MANLKLCPFCGGRVSFAETGNDERQWWFITRGNGENQCTCRMFMESEEFLANDPDELKQKRKKDLIEKWNARAQKEG